jgi:hypothetical protein
METSEDYFSFPLNKLENWETADLTKPWFSFRVFSLENFEDRGSNSETSWVPTCTPIQSAYRRTTEKTNIGIGRLEASTSEDGDEDDAARPHSSYVLASRQFRSNVHETKSIPPTRPEVELRILC